MKITRKKKPTSAGKQSRRNDRDTRGNKKKKAAQSAHHGKRILKKDVLTRAILDTFQLNPRTIYNYKQIAKAIGVEAQVQKLQTAEILRSLADDDVLTETEPGRYRLNCIGESVTGIFRRRSNGRHAFIPDTPATDNADGDAPTPEPINVDDRNTAHALDGDRVRVQLFKRRRGEPEAEVMEVLERAPHTYVGRLEVSKNYAFLVTEDRTLSNDIFIPKAALQGGRTGDKAIVRIVEWPEHASNPTGEVVEVLGRAGDNDTEMHAILAEYGLPTRYPENVEKAARRIPREITAEDIAEREDFREVTTFTIDPKDAKDFDDALSIRRLTDGRWEVGVHIADVTHYVKPGSIIDKEAYERATSVYLVDRTIPMLPECLSNDLCSLRPDEEKLTFSVVFEMNEEADILASRIVRTVIRSDRRFTYDEAQEAIETGSGDFCEEINTLNRLAKKLRERRFAQGAIDFDRYEVKFEIDDKGRPLSVYFKESKDANKLIEEFMLIANRTVAESVGKRSGSRGAKKTFVYRIHEQPDAEKMETFATFVRRFGYKLKTDGSKNEITRSINRLLDDAKGRPEENLIETLAVRSMQKARYSTENIGHYGLAFAYYSHFTSPIRRYPDMMAHRLLVRYADGGRSVSKDACEEECDHCSQMEQLAANAERASIKYKQVEFMSDKIGQVFDGVISGVTEWGLYVELNDNKCEGLVPMRDLDDDFYEFDEANYALVGRRRHRTYRLGDPITITVEHANLERKQLDFRLA